MSQSSKTESSDRAVLAVLPAEQRERLRRLVLVSTDDDYAIAQKIDCNPMHVQAMRNRLVGLGVLARPELKAPSKPRSNSKKPSKYRNGDLFEE